MKNLPEIAQEDWTVARKICELFTCNSTQSMINQDIYDKYFNDVFLTDKYLANLLNREIDPENEFKDWCSEKEYR